MLRELHFKIFTDQAIRQMAGRIETDQSLSVSECFHNRLVMEKDEERRGSRWTQKRFLFNHSSPNYIQNACRSMQNPL